MNPFKVGDRIVCVDAPRVLPPRLWYLASPYTRFPGGPTAAFMAAAANTAVLMQAGVSVFSPIVYAHALVGAGPVLRDREHSFWMAADAPLMDRCDGLIVLQADSWDDSRGMMQELAKFLKDGKPVAFMQPGVVPEGVRA